MILVFLNVKCDISAINSQYYLKIQVDDVNIDYSL